MINKLWALASGQTPKDKTLTPTLLSDLRSNYIPLRYPHLGIPANLTDAQVSDNEVYLQQQLPERERAIKLLLKQQGVDWPESLTGGEGAPLVNDTREWAKAQFPALRALIESLNIREHWLRGERDGDFIGLSLVNDIALLLGQYIVANRPSLYWGIDRDPSNKADDMISCNRWVLMGNWLPDPRITVVIDIEVVVLTLFVDPGDSSERLFNTWQTLIDDCLAGKHEGAALV